MLRAFLMGLIASGALFVGAVSAYYAGKWIDRGKTEPIDTPEDPCAEGLSEQGRRSRPEPEDPCAEGLSEQGRRSRPEPEDPCAEGLSEQGRRSRRVSRINRVIMAFGAGVLLCTLAFELMEDAFRKGGFDHVTLGFLTGALVFLVLDLFLDHLGSGVELMLGALLDGIPESAVIGIGLVATQGLGLIMMVAVFVSNFPEGFSGTRDMLTRKDADGVAQFRPARVIIMWGLVTLVCALSTLAGYAFLGHATDSWMAFMLAGAAGAILAMVAHTMIPEAFQGVWEYTRRYKGTRWLIGDKIEALAVVLGFLVSFLLSRITR